MNERREFLKKIAKGAAYVAPVIYTLSTPRDLMAVVTSGMIMFGNSTLADPAANTAPGSTPPGSTPPGSTPPGSTPPGG